MSVRLGTATGPQWGTTDESYAIFENVEVTTDIEETELMNGSLDVYTVEQHTKRIRVTAEMTYKDDTGKPDADDVGSGSTVTINASDSDINQAVYLRSFSLRKSKGDFRKDAIEGTNWPDLS